MKHRQFKWAIGVGIAVIVLSLIWNWASERTIHEFVVSSQGNLMDGEGLVSQADNLLTHGDTKNAILDA